MDVLSRSIDERLRTDLVAARQRLLAARSVQRTADTPASRSAVEECLARLDRLLDLWNEMSVREAGV
ncbi:MULTISPECIES: hypothetical protein [unclassified Blastococcus]